MLGKTKGKRRRGWQRIRWLDSVTNSMDLSKLWEIVKDRGPWQFMGSQRIRHDLATNNRKDLLLQIPRDKKAEVLDICLLCCTRG